MMKHTVFKPMDTQNQRPCFPVMRIYFQLYTLLREKTFVSFCCCCSFHLQCNAFMVSHYFGYTFCFLTLCLSLYFMKILSINLICIKLMEPIVCLVSIIYREQNENNKNNGFFTQTEKINMHVSV